LVAQLQNTLAHELLHAADWSYSMVGNKDYYKEHKVYDSEGDLLEERSYLTKPTEQKSWAKSLILDIWDRMQNLYTLADLRLFLRKPGKEFMDLVNRSERAEPLRYLEGVDRKKFLLRVFNGLRKLAVDKYQIDSSQFEDYFPRKYDLGGHREPF
jgi:hypothetical protein